MDMDTPLRIDGMIQSYPKDLERTARVRSGEWVRLRPIQPDDEARLMQLYDRLSFDTTLQRFFTRMNRLPQAWAHFLANVDYSDRLALVIEPVEAERTTLIAVARYDHSCSDGVAEVAFVVEDAWQGRGLGTLLLHEILAAAHQRGIHCFRADVLASNRRMLRLLARHTDIVERTTRYGVTELRFRRRVPDTALPSEER
jgi:RimJ/RimL family protein N-acetyltransferase